MPDICRICKKSRKLTNCLTCSIYLKSQTQKEVKREVLDYTHTSEILKSFFRDIDSLSSKEIVQKYQNYYNFVTDPTIKGFLLSDCNFLNINPDDLMNFIQRYSLLNNSIYSPAELLQIHKNYFDTVLDDIEPGIHLDDDQRKAIVTDNDHCLIVAGAGAGKTTTMAAKVKYLVDIKNIPQNEIVVISYTNEATKELKNKIQKKAKLKDVKVSTIHAFAFELIREYQNTPIPAVNIGSKKVISDILISKIYNDKKLLKSLVLFLGFYFNLPEDVFTFENLDQYHQYKASQTYQTLKGSLGDYISKVATQREAKIKTITGEYLRSIQEVQIANFLYLYNIDYEYEKPYSEPVPNSNKLYTPDFHLQQGEHTAYLEHYGVSQSFRNDRFTPAELQRYKTSIIDKRALHRKNKTTLLETWSYYSDGKPLLTHLEETLKEAGFSLTLRNLDEVYNKLVETDKDKYINKLVEFLERFIELYKSAGYGREDFVRLRENKNPRTQLFLDIAEPVYNYYQEYLRASNKIDFADMINDANSCLIEYQKLGKKLPYKYIIIDEFQDVARQRFNLAKELSKISDAKVIAVGDDWQSIFAFAGADITLFLKFVELMGSGEELHITHTYRNSQELIDIAGSFVQKNTSQITKRLVSPKSIANPVVIRPYDNTFVAMVNLATEVSNIIGEILDEFGKESTILLLGRYNFDMAKLKKTGKFIGESSIICVDHPEAKLEFMTVHRAKGLGYDNVILLNMSEGKFGFPCQIENDPILKLVTHEDVTFPFAEERRLFYVALTRTKNRVYVTVPQTRPSRFVVELIKEHNLNCSDEVNMTLIDPLKTYCPDCGYPLKFENNKNYGLPLYVCTNDPEVCNFMTNDRVHKYDIKKCPRCDTGYLIVKYNRENGDVFYGCTNYHNPEYQCGYTEQLGSGGVRD